MVVCQKNNAFETFLNPATIVSIYVYGNRIRASFGNGMMTSTGLVTNFFNLGIIESR